MFHPLANLLHETSLQEDETFLSTVLNSYIITVYALFFHFISSKTFFSGLTGGNKIYTQ